MNKKILIASLIICCVFAANLNLYAGKEEALPVRKDCDSSGGFVASMKKISIYILLYIPNRIVDATDMFAFDMNITDGFAWEMQMTRYCQFGGSNREGYFMCKDYSRQYGFCHKNTKRFGWSFGEDDVTIVTDAVGSVREYTIYAPNFLMANRRLEPFCDGDVDFWKIGNNIGWFIGFGFGIHPVEVADFFTGFVGVDISKDDF
jgi:hypothetical protein